MVVGDLGFRAIVVLVLVVFPAIGLFIRRKWRHAAARREEIRLLLAMAAKEAATAELEANFEYAASTAATVAPTGTLPRYCVVCYTPTTSRCRRCKSVRYCSKKCQVIHWRQGHKDECFPAPVSPDMSDENGKLASESVKQNHHDDDLISKSAGEESEYESDSSIVHAQNLPTKDTMRHHHVPNGSTPVRGNSTVSDSFTDHKEFNDNSFGRWTNVMEDEDIHDLDASEDGLPGMSHPVNNLDPFADAKKLNSTKSSSSYASVVELDRTVSESNNAKRESECISTSSSDSDENLPEPSAVTSGFWDGNLESVMTNTSIQTGMGKTNYDKLTNKNASDPRSFARSTFDFSGESSSDLHVKGSELSNHTFARRPQTSKSMKEATFSGKEAMASSRSSNSVLLTPEQPISVHKDTSSGFNDTKREGPKHLSSNASFDRSSTVKGRYPAADALKDHAITRNSSNVTQPGGAKHLSSNASFDCSSIIKGCYAATDAVKSHAINVSGRSKQVSAAMKESSQLSTSETVGTPKDVSEAPSSSHSNNHSTSALKPIKVASDNKSVVHNQARNILPNATHGPKTSRVKINQSTSAKLSRYYSFGAGSGASVKKIEKGLFSYEMFVKLYNWKEVELRPCGLINCGNSCYANVVLQCLTFTPPLTAYLLQALHSKTCAKKDWCFTCDFERLIITVKDRSTPLSPISILSHIEKIGSHLTSGREEDAHEFMRYAVDTMQSICLQEAGVTRAKCLEEETTLLGLTFGGYLRSKIRCMRCRGKSEQHERIMDLTVEIGGDIETLEEALGKFTAVEILDGENKYQCSRCKSYEKAKKRLTIFEAPNVLMIALKRFQAGKFGKLNKSIGYPETLDLAPFMRGASDNSPIYRLYGVIVHLDVMNTTFSGHYICYVRNAQNKWFKIDDSVVKAVEMESVLKERAYMLFYSRYSPRAPQSVRDSVIYRDVSNKEKFPESKSFPGIDGKGGLRPGGGKSLHQKQAPPRAPNDANPETGSTIQRFQEESSSETCSIFSHSSEGTSTTTTDSNQESSSTTTDEYLDHIFGEGMHNHYSFWRNPSDSDTSSSSSTSSSPLYATRPSPLSNSERYASAHSDDTHLPIRAGDLKSGGRREASILHSESMKQCRKVVNSSSCSISSSSRETDSSGRLVGWSNP